MTVTITKDEINLRDKLVELSADPTPKEAVFYFTGDSSTVDFTLTYGWKPKYVYSAGLRKRLGSTADYTINNDAGVWTVTFAVAPAVVSIDIDAEAQI